MKVGELIYILQQLPEDLDVVFPDYREVVKVLRIVDPRLPQKLTDTVILTDEEE